MDTDYGGIMNKKIEFEEFISSVANEDQDFAKKLHDRLMELQVIFDNVELLFLQILSK